VTYRDTLQGLLDRARKPERIAELEAELAAPPLPSALSYLWTAYSRLAARRGSNGSGPNFITYTDIDAFARLTGIRLNAWEIEMIEALDRCYIAERYRSKTT
jgi:hypothetical protein